MYIISSVYYQNQNQVLGRFVITCQILHEQDKERLGPWAKAAYQTQPSDHGYFCLHIFSVAPHLHCFQRFSSICFAENTHPEVSVQRPSPVIIELPKN